MLSIVKALENFIMALAIKLETHMRVIFSRVNFMVMVHTIMQMVTNLLVDLGLAKKQDVEFFTHMMVKQFQVDGEMTN